MLIIPPKLKLTRNVKAEESLMKKTKDWLERQNGERDPRIHASSLLDPRKSYFDTKFPQPMTNRMVGLFFFGKVLHAFFLSALGEETGTNWKADVGSVWDEELGICWSNDWQKKVGKETVPYEFKTSRSKYEQKRKDLDLYLEQLMIYMVGQKSTHGRLIVLQSNLPAPRGEGWGSYPQYRAYDVEVTKKELDGYRKQIIETRKKLEKALKTEKFQELPLCRPFKCGPEQCPHWDRCKPKGRYP